MTEKRKFNFIQRDETVKDASVDDLPIQREHIYQKSTIDQLLRQDHPELRLNQERLAKAEPPVIQEAPIRLKEIPDDIDYVKEAFSQQTVITIIIIAILDFCIFATTFQPFEDIRTSWLALSYTALTINTAAVLLCLIFKHQGKKKDIPALRRSSKRQTQIFFWILIITLSVILTGYRPNSNDDSKHDEQTPKSPIHKIFQ